MQTDFDAEKEADTIEQLAKKRFNDDQSGKPDTAAVRLCKEWLSLNQTQRDQVASVLEKKYSQEPDLWTKWFSNDKAMPKASSIYDEFGNVVGLEFNFSLSKLRCPGAIKIKDTGTAIEEQHYTDKDSFAFGLFSSSDWLPEYSLSKSAKKQ